MYILHCRLCLYIVPHYIQIPPHLTNRTHSKIKRSEILCIAFVCTCAMNTTCLPLNFFSSSRTSRVWIFWYARSCGTGTKMTIAFLFWTSISCQIQSTHDVLLLNIDMITDTIQTGQLPTRAFLVGKKYFGFIPFA